MKWKNLLPHLRPEAESFAIDFYGADDTEVKEFIAESGLPWPRRFGQVNRYNRSGKHIGWVSHYNRHMTYEADNPVIRGVQVFDFAEAYAICCGNETYSNISLEEVLVPCI